MKNTFALLGFLLVFGSMVHAQEVQINEGPKIGDMMRTWASNNFKGSKIEGWRVQVLSTTDRQQAESAKLRVASEFPDQYVDWINEKPYYKLRVGACRTRNEALALVQVLKDFYPNAYPAQDKNISPRDFLAKQ
jgi:hypothetical protein